MRRIVLTAAGLLAACATNPQAGAQPVQATPIHGETPGHTCRTAGTDRFIGKTGTKMMGAAIKDVTRAAVLRWAPPYTMLSMEFRADRVNVYVDAHKKITKINCG
jgi:hypothetical protein